MSAVPSAPAGAMRCEPLSIRRLRDGHCRWIVRQGSPAETRYCAEPARGGSWCDAHRAVVFQPRERRP